MREFFIHWSEKLVGVLMVLMVIGVLIATVAAMSQGGLLQGLAVLVFGLLYVVVMGGMLYIFFGIYRNTQRTNVLLEELARR